MRWNDSALGAIPNCSAKALGVSPLDASPAFRAAEAAYGDAWYAAISADTWGAGA